MEFVSGKISLRKIFQDWWEHFVNLHPELRESILINVFKMMACKTLLLGAHLQRCLTCGATEPIPHTCKSRFCSSCGKKATDEWIKTNFNVLPDTTWQHITFTMPSQIWELFWFNRHLFNLAPALSANLILDLAHQQGFYPGIFQAGHTFGRQLNRNLHLHLSTTVGGFSRDRQRWINKGFFHHKKLKKMWRYQIINLLRQQHQLGQLLFPDRLAHLRNYRTFNSWLDHLYQKEWVVHLNHQSDNHRATTEYLGRYLKRPPLGETRLLAYDGQEVRFEFLDHYTKEKATLTLPVLDFIARLISHIPDLHFRVIRYYGFLSNRLRGALLPRAYTLLNQTRIFTKKVRIPWHQLFKNTFRRDPRRCPKCGALMQIFQAIFPPKIRSILDALRQGTHPPSPSPTIP